MFKFFLRWLLLLFFLIVTFSEAQSSGSFWVPVNPQTHYKIECSVDTSTKRLTGKEEITFSGESTKKLTQVALDWSVNSSQTIKVLIDGKQLPIIGDTGQRPISSPILFEIPDNFKSSKEIKITLDFSYAISLMGIDNKIILTDWYPKVDWGIKTHDVFDVKIEIPSDYGLGTSGLYNMKSGYYHVENATSFGLFIGKGFKTAEAKSGEVLISCLYNEEGEKCASYILKRAVDVVNFYTEYFGFYPYKSLTIVPGFDQPWGGYDAATSLSVIHGEENMSKKPEVHWQWITAHEIGHMYWGEYAIDKDSPAWLWIGLGIYADREYMRSRGLGKSEHNRFISTYLEGVQQHINTTVAISPQQLSSVTYDYNNIVTHGKGYSIISALANYLGKETFGHIYKRTLKEYGGINRLGLAEFKKICEDESKETLDWFFDQWVYSDKYLSYKINSQKCSEEKGKYVSEIDIERLGTLKMPVPVTAYFNDGSTQTKFTDRLLDINSLHFISTSPLKNIMIDPDSELAIILPPPDMTVEEVEQEIKSLPWEKAGVEALSAFNKASELKLKNGRLWYRLGIMLYDGEYYNQSLEAFRKVIEVHDTLNNKEYPAHVLQGHILDLMNKRDEAISEYKMALSMDEGGTVILSQYGISINRKWIEERLVTPFKRI